MSKPENLSRIFLSQDGIKHAFYWVSLGSDRSIYFGSSNASKFGYGFAETVDLPASGARVAPNFNGREMQTRELTQKHSLHTSGIALLPTRSTNRRDEYQIRNLEDYAAHLPLVGVLPMPIHRYPRSEKLVRPSDIVIDIGGFGGFPYAVLLYAHQQAAAEPETIRGFAAKYSTVLKETATVSDDLQVSAVAYSEPENFTYWRHDEYVVTARPNPETLDSIWPIFGTT